MKRIFLFIATNLAVLVLLGAVVFIIQGVFGVRLPQGGLGGLLVMAATKSRILTGMADDSFLIP